MQHGRTISPGSQSGQSIDETAGFCYAGRMNEHSSDKAEPPSPESDPLSSGGAKQRRQAESFRGNREVSHDR